MPASNHTNNLSLPIYAAEDHVSILGDFNDAMRTLDSEVSAAVEAGNSASTDAANALAAANTASEAAARAKESADSTLTTAATASELAREATNSVATLRSRVDNVETTASNARSTAAAAESAANTALQRANAASSTADAAASTANSISGTADTALATAQNAASEISAVTTRAGLHNRIVPAITTQGLAAMATVRPFDSTITGLIPGQVYHIHGVVHLAYVKAEVIVEVGDGDNVVEYVINTNATQVSVNICQSFVADSDSQRVYVNVKNRTETVEFRENRSWLQVTG